MKSKPSRAAAIPQPYADRLRRVRESLGARKLDGYLVVSRMDQFWLTGFTGEDGAALITPSRVTLLTDGRFDETADREAPWATKVVRTQRGPDSIAAPILRHKLRRVGFDPGDMNVALYTALARLIRPGKLAPVSGIVRDLRVCKDAGEVEAIRRAIRIAEDAFSEIRPLVRPGISESDLSARLSFAMKQRGASGDAFSPIVAFGANGSLPHYETGDARLREGEGVLVDWGCRAGWYVSDLTRMIWPSSIPPRLRGAYDAVVAAHDRAIEAIRPGVSAESVDRVARDVIRKAGYDKQFTHSLGHGIGLDVHEAPRVGKRAADPLRPGMVVTVEPGVYLPGVGGVRVEDDVLVTETGFEVLSSLPN